LRDIGLRERDCTHLRGRRARRSRAPSLAPAEAEPVVARLRDRQPFRMMHIVMTIRHPRARG
jgi:hypothetical protein